MTYPSAEKRVVYSPADCAVTMLIQKQRCELVAISVQILTENFEGRREASMV